MATPKVTSRPKKRRYTLDGEPISIAAFIRANEETFDHTDVARIRALRRGHSIDYGGGAGASFVLWRVR